MRANIIISGKKKVKHAKETDSMLKSFKTQSIDSWVDENVETVEDIKNVLKRILKVQDHLISAIEEGHQNE